MTTAAEDPLEIPDWFWGGIMAPDGRQDPWPLFARLDGKHACSHAAAAAALRDPRFRVLRPEPNEHLVWQVFDRFLISLDGDAHAAIRGRLARAFTKRAVEGYRAGVEETVGRLLDELEPRGHAELVRDFAFALPIHVISELMALPPAARAGLDQLLLDFSLAFVNRDDEAALDAGDRAVAVLLDRMRAVMEERRDQPGDDLLSRLLGYGDEPEPDGSDAEPAVNVTFEDLVVNAVFLLQAGHETTQNTIASAVYALLEEPRALARLREDPALIPDAVEEVLRLHSAISVAPRMASETVELPTGTVPAGAVIPFFLAAVNRDPAVFDRPETLDIERRPNPHLAFAAGAHRCLGAPLARLEVQAALRGIVTRFPDLRLVEPPRWRGVIPFRGLEALHVAW